MIWIAGELGATKYSKTLLFRETVTRYLSRCCSNPIGLTWRSAGGGEVFG
jgi:hypothetical protein